MAFAARRPDIDLTLVEAGPTLGGEHTWSFFATDLDAEASALVAPLVAHSWDGYEVRFRSLSRTLTTSYRSVTSDRLHRVAAERLGASVRLGAAVERIDGAGVTLAGGERLEADAVVDARGPRRLDGVTLAFQKFLGREVRLRARHGLTQPTIMDATVDQHDGYRFVYLLPFGPDRVLIEDTYYANTPDVDRPLLRERISAYAASRGWTIAEDVREEVGALPLLLSGDFRTMWRAASADGAVPVGLRAGLFHPVTGYSLSLAARTAVAMAAPGPLSTPRLMATVEGLVRRHFARAAFDRMLNRMLFLAGRPEERHRVLERFHKLPQALIERFYAGRMERRDVARVLIGRPPVPVLEALRVLPERAALR